ncbi:unnamed protein product [Closterium sp. NIES-64]|nr:unnamed protein product [Closterium sp. NIES-64]
MVTRRPSAPSKCAADAASGLASAWSCCVPLAADRAALARLFPPLAPSYRAAAAVLPNAKRRRSTLPAPGARRAGGTCPRALPGGAAPSPPSGTAPPSPCRADSAPATLDGSSRARPAPAVQSSPCAALPRGGRLNRAIPAAGPLIPRPPPGSSLLALPPARFPHRPFLLDATAAPSLSARLLAKRQPLPSLIATSSVLLRGAKHPSAAVVSALRARSASALLEPRISIRAFGVSFVIRLRIGYSTVPHSRDPIGAEGGMARRSLHGSPTLS